jgi:hypothetical protein
MDIIEQIVKLSRHLPHEKQTEVFDSVKALTTRYQTRKA